MTLPASGSITIGAVAAELGIGLPLSLGDSRVLALAGKGSAPISLTDLYGKSAYTLMSATLNDGSITGPAGNTGPAYDATTSLTISLAGGVAPYSYAWTKVSGSGSVDAANAATTTARMTVQRLGAEGQQSTLVVQCVVTDSTGNTITRQCTVTLTLI